MFVHQTSLPHVLPPGLYSGQEQYDLELRKIFQPAWHLVGDLGELGRDGDFLTLELLGRPLLVRNCDGEIRTFLNVCTHRHALLTSRPHGNAPKLVCQYHGWEYNCDGRTGRIPDAQSFKPLPGGPECLQAFRTAVQGPFVYVCLEKETPPWDQACGPLLEPTQEFAADRWRAIERWSTDLAVNWKIPVENTLESYHLPILHPNTLINYDTEENIRHEVQEQGVVMRVTRAPTSIPQTFLWLANLVLPWLEPNASHEYRLFQGFPNTFLIRSDHMLQAMDVSPTSPQTCRLTVRVFSLRAVRENAFTRFLTWSWGKFKTAIVRRILAEDFAIYPALQQGMNASPFHGTISSREELVFAFQRFVRTRCEEEAKLQSGGEGSL